MDQVRKLCLIPRHGYIKYKMELFRAREDKTCFWLMYMNQWHPEHCRNLFHKLFICMYDHLHIQRETSRGRMNTYTYTFIDWSLKINTSCYMLWWICAFVYAFACSCVCVCVCLYLYVYVHVNMHRYVYVECECVHVHVHGNVYMYVGYGWVSIQHGHAFDYVFVYVFLMGMHMDMVLASIWVSWILYVYVCNVYVYL